MSVKLQWFLMISLFMAVIILIGINVTYNTTENYTDIENYTENIPYNITENYTEKESYIAPMYSGYVYHNDMKEGDSITYILNNVTSYNKTYVGKDFKGQDQYNYTFCYGDYCRIYPYISWESIKEDNITEYRLVQKTRETTKFRLVQKIREINKTRYLNLSLLQRILHNSNNSNINKSNINNSNINKSNINNSNINKSNINNSNITIGRS